MSEKIRRIFPGNNSTRGFYSYYAECLEGLEQIYILKGGPGTGKSSLLKRLSERLQREGLQGEHWLCSSDPDSLDGVLFPELKIAVVDGTAPHVVEPRYPGAVETIVNLGDCWDEALLNKRKDRIIELTDGISAAFTKAYAKTAAIGKIDELFGVTRKEEEEETEVATILPLLLPEIHGDRGSLRRFFAMAMTPQGVLDLRAELCTPYGNRLFLLGANRSGCNRVLHTLAEAAVRLHFPCEIGYGAFEPTEAVTVLLPSLDLAVSTLSALPASLRREDDRVVVLESKATNHSRYTAERERETVVKDAVAALAEAHRRHDELEEIYIAAMDFSKVERLEKKVYENIMKFAAKS